MLGNLSIYFSYVCLESNSDCNVVDLLKRKELIPNNEDLASTRWRGCRFMVTRSENNSLSGVYHASGTQFINLSRRSLDIRPEIKFPDERKELYKGEPETS